MIMGIKYLLPSFSVFFLIIFIAQAQASEKRMPEVELQLSAVEEIQDINNNENNLAEELSKEYHLANSDNKNFPLDSEVEYEQSIQLIPVVNQLKAEISPKPETFREQNPEVISNNNQVEPGIFGLSDDLMEQVNNVFQLRDIRPKDWAFQALRSLVERYGCIAGYPDGTFRGDRSITRYEFAAGLNACLQQIETLINNNQSVSQEDLERLQRLIQEFETELAAIETQVDNLEGRVAFLEDHQFSTTTILNGEVIFAIADAFGGDPPGGCIPNLNNDSRVDCRNPGEPETNTVLAYLARLGLQTSFTGKDRLRTYLTTGNFDNGGFTNAQSLNTYMSRLSYQAGLENQVILDLLEYRFPIFDDRVVISAIPFGFSLSNVLTANSPYFDTGRGAISRFGEASPIFKIGGVLDAGVGFDWLIADPLRLQLAYGTGDSSDPDRGFLGAERSALGVQLLVQPFEKVLTGITYVNAYSSDGTLGTFTGSANAETSGFWSGAGIPDPTGQPGPGNGNPNPPSGFGCCPFPVGDFPAQINAVGGTLQWRLADKLTFGAWGGYIFTNFLERLPDFDELGASAGKKPFANSATFQLSLGLSDPFGREGDLFAFIFGMPPKLVDAGPETVGVPLPFFEISRRGESEVAITDNNPNILNGPQRVGVEDEATSLHFEFFYRFKVNDNISITPGFFFVTNPGHIADNDTLYVGTIRTTFRF